MNWLSSDGCIGSWCWSWPTSSLRKSSFPRSPAFFAETFMPSVPTGALLAYSIEVGSVIVSASLGQDVHQHAVRQLEGRLHGHFRVRARGVAGPVRLAAALATAVVAEPGAGAAGRALVTGRLADVEAEQVHALALELAAEVGRSLLQLLHGLGGVRDDGRDQAVTGVT